MEQKKDVEEKKKTPKFYQNLTIEQKKKLRGQLEAVVENKKKQLELFENNFIRPLKEQIRLAEKVRKNEVSLQQYVALNEKWSKWLQTFMGRVAEGMKENEQKESKTTD